MGRVKCRVDGPGEITPSLDPTRRLIWTCNSPAQSVHRQPSPPQGRLHRKRQTMVRPRGRSLNDKLARLRALLDIAAAPESLRELRTALGSRSKLVVREAAEVIA